MIIHNFNVFGPCASPTEAEAELIIDANTILPRTIAFQRFQPIPWRHTQIA